MHHEDFIEHVILDMLGIFCIFITPNVQTLSCWSLCKQTLVILHFSYHDLSANLSPLRISTWQALMFLDYFLQLILLLLLC